ncbi:response regulator receiver modulated diguanylate cyclase/phosphodiesterase with PAS/PAC sensor(s) [Paramagnetospirillum caucaseum]|uniref:Response regulator receiver modulated diguanylate cyclase/phosphodiesterase with PAS/PAC sensor(S) n=1 Tax=Paramagnetospirillum caucaseum TaxID=1244869 RepID=M2Y927_9PROT|nr:response regulator receiver modulated diguanylate cyclase/phosphodiesterase with PAS/PAC sensor(s) [Paramagnetospirillum caucaseum]
METSINILIIEDVRADFLMVERHLHRNGLAARCSWAVNAVEIAAALERGKWDLVLSDYNVPGLDFHENLAHIRGRFPNLPVLLVSGSVGEEEAVELLKIGTWDFVLKDNLTRLVPSVRRALAEAAEREALRLAEEGLRLSEERFQLAMRGANDGLWDWNLKSNQVYFSPRWKGMLGYGEGELEASPFTWVNLLHPDDRLPTQARMGEFLKGGDDRIELQFRMRHKGGGDRYIRAPAFLTRDAQGRPERLVGTHIDITEAKEAETSLRQAAAVFTSTLEAVFVIGLGGGILAVNPAFSTISEYPEGEVLSRGMDFLLANQDDRAFHQAIWQAVRENGAWQGEVSFRRRGGDAFPAWLGITSVGDEKGEPINYVGVFTDLSRLKHSEAKLQHLAHHDPLTGLPNRVLLQLRLEHALDRSRRDGRRCAVLFLDLDHFKVVNDSLGHDAGDEVLQVIGHRLRDQMGEADTLARLGGDEFVMVVETVAQAEDAASIAQAMIDVVGTPYRLNDSHEVSLRASVGVSLFPDDGEGADQLIQNADTAVHQAKQEGRNGYRFYTRSLTEKANRRLEMEAGLRRALDLREFVLHYQPLISLTGGRVEGVEALVRWQPPGREIISPYHFIPLAEETGLIVALGDWVLQEACTQMKSWLDLGLRLDKVAVNLSAQQFRLSYLQERIRDILSESGLPPCRLELELTETTIMARGDEAGIQMAALKDQGVHLSIDDFGTGYSSLAYLRRFPLDKLKIDQSFVRDIPHDEGAAEITSTIIAMAKNLKLSVLAEGVETPEQLDFLTGRGCDSCQGFFFSRPLAADDFRHWMDRAAGP